MMKAIGLTTGLLVLLLVMWLPVRTPADVFEYRALEEALMIRTGEGIPMPSLTAEIAGDLMVGFDWLTGAPDRFRIRPYGPEHPEDPFAEIGRAAERSTLTPWMRSMKSMAVMALQRLAVMIATSIALLPLMLALTVDGFVARRIREAQYHAPRPSLWHATLVFEAGLVSMGFAALFVPILSPVWLPVFPIGLAISLRVTAATWHRFI